MRTFEGEFCILVIQTYSTGGNIRCEDYLFQEWKEVKPANSITVTVSCWWQKESVTARLGILGEESTNFVLAP
jgi:hypothetical protein